MISRGWNGTLRERFYRRISKRPNGCWLWTGALMSRKVARMNYGIIRNEISKNEGAHRVSWRLHKGEIGPGLCVLHKCDNPQCVNPDHLFLGSHQDNARDRSQKGRGGKCGAPKGNQNRRKLSDEDEQEILTLRRGEAMKRFEISDATYYRIRAKHGVESLSKKTSE